MVVEKHLMLKTQKWHSLILASVIGYRSKGVEERDSIENECRESLSGHC
jgi:hypothetical protein